MPRGARGEGAAINSAAPASLPAETLRLADLREAFSESDLPFKVDILDWAATAEPFRRLIEQDSVVVQPARDRAAAAVGRSE